MGSIVVDGGLINYEAYGRGRPVVLIHGWLGSWRYWWPTMSALSERYRCYAMDLLGFGDSDKSPSRYDIDSYVTLLLGFMDAIGVVSAPLIGHALGAAVALLLSERQPDRVVRLMTVSLPVVGMAISRKLYMGDDNVLDRLMGRKQARSISADVAAEADKADPNAITLSARSLVSLDLRSILESTRVPTLLVHGGKDSIVAPPESEWLKSADVECVRMMILKNSAHFPMIDEAGEFERLAKSFLESSSLSRLELKEAS